MRTGAPVRLLAIALTILVTVSGLSITASADSSQPGAPAIWLSTDEILSLPTTGEAWSRVKAAADTDLAGGVLTNRDDHNTRTLAAALVGARLDSITYKQKAVAALAGVVAAPIDTNDVLAAARRLGTYVIAADVVRLPLLDPAFDAVFKDWVRGVLAHRFAGGGGGGTIAEVQERRGNNFGSHAGASRTAAALYLGDGAELDRAATVFRGWLGDRSAYAGFAWGDLSWQCDRARPVGINAKGCTIDGHTVDGVLPDDQRRGGAFTWPPPKENYVWGGLQGALVQAELLRRQGVDAWAWQDQALRRAVRWLYDVADFPAAGDDTWQPWLVNFAYGSDIPAEAAGRGKNMAYTDWTHAGRTAAGATTAPTAAPTAAPTTTTTTTSPTASTTTSGADDTGTTSSSPVALRSASAAGATSTTSLSLPTPAGVAAGDVLVATIDVRGKPKITAPKGWQLLRSDVTGRHLSKATYVHSAGPSEPGSYQWAFNKGVRSASGVIVAVSGVDGAAPVAAVTGAPGDGSATLVAPSAGVSSPGSGMLAIFGLDDDAAVAAPAGMALAAGYAVDDFVDVTSAVAFGVHDAQGSTGDKVATASGPGASVGHLVVLRPA